MPRSCSICVNPKRSEIEEALIRGESYRRISTDFIISPEALRRHRKNGHIEESLIKAHELNKIVNADDLLVKISIVNYSKQEINNSVRNQNYLGFQIFKNTYEVRSLFGDILKDNLILKYSSHIDSISIIRISNNLAKLESILNSKSNYDKCAESGVEYAVVNGRDINPENDDKYLLLKKTSHSDRFVVYDSGFFEEEKKDLLLNRYVLKDKSSNEVSNLLFKTFSLMKQWLPDLIMLAKNESRFRIIKEYFSPNTNSRTKKSKIFVADIVELNKRT